MSKPASLADALNSTLAGEYAAIYGYGLVAAQLVGTTKRQAQSAIDSHRVRRDQMRASITATGQSPPIPAAAYDSSTPVTTPAQASDLAAAIESGLAGSYAQLAALSADGERRTAALAAQESAVRAASWSTTTQAFPGSVDGPLANAVTNPTGG